MAGERNADGRCTEGEDSQQTEEEAPEASLAPVPAQSPSIRLKVERAKEHIAYLNKAIGEFRERNPYRAIVDPDTVKDWYGTFTVHMDEPMPGMWGVIVGETIHNLRTSLDNAWFVVGGRTRRDEFPFAQDPDGFKARFKGKEKGALKQAVDILHRVESYKTGNPLWPLSQLDNLNKHEAPLLCSSRIRDFVVAVPGKPAIRPTFLEPLEEGAVFVLPVLPGREMNMEHKLPFEVTFAEMKFTKGEAVIPVLEHYAGAADSIISAFVAEGLIA